MHLMYMVSSTFIIMPGVYSFCLSVHPFIYIRWYVCSYKFPSVAFGAKFYIKVSQMGYISPSTHQKAFIFGP